MGSSHSVIWGSKQREDISYSDIEYKHGKLWNTLAPRDDHLSLTSVSNFNAAKINSPIYKEPIYRGPGAGQQMVVSPCFLNYRVENTLSSEELDQLDRIQKNVLPNEQPKYPNFNLIFPNPVSSTINPNPPWFKNEAIHEDHQDVNADGKFKNCPTYTNINAEDTRTLVSGEPKFNHDAIHLDYQKLCISSNPHTVLRSSYYKSGLNFPNPVPSTIIPNPRCFNNEAIHEDHQDLNANRNSRKRQLSTNNKADNRAAAGLKAFSILLLLTSPAAAYPVSAYPVSQGLEVEIKILRDSDNLNCTLKIDNKYVLCCGHCDQNLIHHQHISDDILENLLVNVRKELKEAMEVNQISLRKKDGLRSGTLELIFLWKLIFNNTINETIQCIFNGKKLPDKEITKLPMTMISVYMEKMKDHFEELWESSREMKLSFLNIDDQPENKNSSGNAKASTDTRKSWIIAIPITGFAVCFIGAIAIWFVKCSGKETCKELYETCLTYRRAAQNEAEAEGDPNVMEV